MNKTPIDDSICEMLNPTGIYAIDLIAKNVDYQIRNKIKNMEDKDVSSIVMNERSKDITSLRIGNIMKLCGDTLLGQSSAINGVRIVITTDDFELAGEYVNRAKPIDYDAVHNHLNKDFRLPEDDVRKTFKKRWYQEAFPDNVPKNELEGIY